MSWFPEEFADSLDSRNSKKSEPRTDQDMMAMPGDYFGDGIQDDAGRYYGEDRSMTGNQVPEQVDEYMGHGDVWRESSDRISDKDSNHKHNSHKKEKESDNKHSDHGEKGPSEDSISQMDSNKIPAEDMNNQLIDETESNERHHDESRRKEKKKKKDRKSHKHSKHEDERSSADKELEASHDGESRKEKDEKSSKDKSLEDWSDPSSESRKNDPSHKDQIVRMAGSDQAQSFPDQSTGPLQGAADPVGSSQGVPRQIAPEVAPTPAVPLPPPAAQNPVNALTTVAALYPTQNKQPEVHVKPTLSLAPGSDLGSLGQIGVFESSSAALKVQPFLVLMCITVLLTFMTLKR